MTRDTPAPLFYPFETGDLSLPGSNDLVLFLGAGPNLPPQRDFRQLLNLVQGFRPDYLALRRMGHKVTPEPEGDAYDLALVLASRHRGLTENRLAEAIARTKQGAPVVVAGGKTDGAASLRKRLAQEIAIGGHLSKNHGIVFWFPNNADAKAWAAKLKNAATDISRPDGRFRAAPGMFSHDRVDAGSQLLAENLPQNLKGLAADFCAGWGYLSVVLAERASEITGIDLYEADHASLEAARTNMASLAPLTPATFHWVDLAAEKVERRYDVVVMNPPFHQGRAADPGIGHAMLRAASGALRAGGQLVMVANRGLPYEPILKASFARANVIARDTTYVVWHAYR